MVWQGRPRSASTQETRKFTERKISSFLSLAAPEVVKMTTSGAAGDENYECCSANEVHVLCGCCLQVPLGWVILLPKLRDLVGGNTCRVCHEGCVNREVQSSAWLMTVMNDIRCVSSFKIYGAVITTTVSSTLNYSALVLSYILLTLNAFVLLTLNAIVKCCSKSVNTFWTTLNKGIKYQ